MSDFGDIDHQIKGALTLLALVKFLVNKCKILSGQIFVVPSGSKINVSVDS